MCSDLYVNMCADMCVENVCGHADEGCRRILEGDMQINVHACDRGIRVDTHIDTHAHGFTFARYKAEPSHS